MTYNKKRTFLFIFIFISFHTFSANDNHPFGGRSAGMANASVTLYDFWAVSHNQAGIAKEESISAGFFYENRFGIKELGLGAVAFILPVDAGVFGLNYSQFGYSKYNESKIGLAFAKNFAENLSTGIQLNYLSTRIADDFGSASTLTFEAGAIYQITTNLYAGAHIFNPIKREIGDYANERIPSVLKFGMSYVFSEKVVVIMETEKELYQNYNLKLGIEYKITEPIHIRGGIMTQNHQNAFGFGFYLNNFRIDIAASYHNVLGYSPQFSLLYMFN